MTRSIAFVALLAALAFGASGAAQSQPQGRFAFERPVIAARTGPQKLALDRELLAGGSPFRVIGRRQRLVAEDGLADLRLFDSRGAAVPYLLVHPPAADPQWAIGRVLAIQPTKKTSGFEVDFGRAQLVDMISVEGIPAPFLKRLSVEGSGDRARWTSLAPEATLFDLPSEKLRQTQLGFVPGAYRYIRVIWDDTNSGRVPLPRIVRARLAGDVPRAETLPIELEFERQASEPGKSRYRVRLPAPRFPVTAIELDVAGGHVFRTAAVTESRFAGQEAAPVELGRATLSRVVQDGVHAADLRIPITPPVEADLQVSIDDGSNPPLEVKRVLAHLAELPVIYFEAPAGDLIARYGDHALDRPEYDLEAARRSIDLRSVPDASWGPPRRLIETAGVAAPGNVPQPGGTLDPGGFRHVRPVPADSTGLVALQLDAAALAQSRGPAARFADVRVLDASNRQLPYLIERRDEPVQVALDLELAQGQAPELKRAPGRSVSVYKVKLPYPNLPPGTLVLETASRVFQRTVQLGIERAPDRSRRDTRFDVLASETWRHADQETAARALSLRIPPTEATELLLVVDEGDNAPLPIGATRLLLPSYRLRYYQPGEEGVRLAYGRDDLQLPQYDLALLAQQVMGASARELAPAAESQPSSPDGRDIISPVTFWILISGAVLVLIGVIVKLFRSP